MQRKNCTNGLDHQMIYHYLPYVRRLVNSQPATLLKRHIINILSPTSDMLEEEECNFRDGESYTRFS